MTLTDGFKKLEKKKENVSSDYVNILVRGYIEDRI